MCHENRNVIKINWLRVVTTDDPSKSKSYYNTKCWKPWLSATSIPTSSYASHSTSASRLLQLSAEKHLLCSQPQARKVEKQDHSCKSWIWLARTWDLGSSQILRDLSDQALLTYKINILSHWYAKLCINRSPNISQKNWSWKTLNCEHVFSVASAVKAVRKRSESRRALGERSESVSRRQAKRASGKAGGGKEKISFLVLGPSPACFALWLISRATRKSPLTG